MKRFVLATGRTTKRFRDLGQRQPMKARDGKEALPSVLVVLLFGALGRSASLGLEPIYGL